MANRFPLTLNKTTKKIEEIPAGETLDISGCGIVGGTNAEFSGTVEAQEYLIAGQPVSVLLNGDWNTLANKPTALSQFVNDVGFITEDSDNQTLGLVGSVISISDGNSLDMSTLFELDLTDGILTIAAGSAEIDLSGALAASGQTLSLDGNVLSISGTNSVDLSSIQSADTLDDVLARGNTSLFPITVGAVNAGEIIQTGTGVATITSGSDIRFNAGNGAGVIDVGGSAITNVPFPTQPSDVVIKQYVDSLHNGSYMAFGRNATDETVPVPTAANGYFQNADGDDIEVSFEASQTSREVLVELNGSFECTADPLLPSLIGVKRSINGGAYETVKSFTFPEYDKLPYGFHMMFLDVYTGANVGDIISYKVFNNMGELGNEVVTIRYGLCGDTFGAREV